MTENKNPEKLEVLWTVPMVAKYLSFTEGAVYKWIAAGKIKAVKIGNKSVRVPKSEVERIVGEATSNLKP
jgi:excisionase family DNA binding protein